MAAGITISKSMKSKLPESEREGIDNRLWSKSGGVCWLCQAPLNRSSDTIVADHEIAESEGGPTEFANLNLAHTACNSAKRAAKTIDIRPYLRLVSYSNKRRLKYDGYLDHFKISPAEVFIEKSEDTVKIELPDGTFQICQIFVDATPTHSFEYVFVDLPRAAIFNDDKCQPRAIRPDHAWAIFGDLQRNPLHEPPSCRTEESELGRRTRLLMFDGQHKTVASWMMGRSSVTAKLYLNLSSARANELVNSIQAKIKKLPLSPFELAGKMSDEWENKFKEYEEAVGSADISERGFIDWLPTSERTRGKQALAGALVQSILGDESLLIKNYVKKPGRTEPFEITESVLKSKVIEALTIKEPQAGKGEEAQAARDREAANIVRCLNILSDLAFAVPEGVPERTPQAAEAARRMAYQPSLSYISKLIRELWFQLAVRTNDKNLMDDQVTDDHWSRISVGIERLVLHPLWTAQPADNPDISRLLTNLTRNQVPREDFESLGLTMSYLVVGEQDAAFKKRWA